MTVTALIQLLFAALVLITGLDWLRHRSRARLDIWLVFCCLLIPALLPAQSPSYVGQVQPFFARYCNGCHGGWVPKGGLHTGSVASLQKGGKTGPAVVPGDLDKSVLIQRLQPKADVKPMPPAEARQPLPEEIDMIRSWIASGARDDSGSPRAKIADVPPAGTLTAKLDGLPPRATAQPLAVSPGAGRVEFVVAVATTTPPGGHRSLVCELAGEVGGRQVVYRVGRGGTLTVQPPGAGKTDADGKPLSPLDALRQAQKKDTPDKP